MEKTCWLKFSQNEHLKNQRLASQGLFVEANRCDMFFSCGLSLSNPNILGEKVRMF